MNDYIAGFLDGEHEGGQRGFRYGFLCACFLIASLSLLLSIFSGCSYNYSFVEENDALTFFNEDEYFTQGLELRADKEGERFAIGQQIYTPDNKRTSELIENDRPYAGYLYGAYQTDRWHNADHSITYRTELGLVGQGAGGRWVQNNFHDLIDNRRVNGWSNQLENEPTVNFTYEESIYGFTDIFPALPLYTRTYYGGSFGNLRTRTHTGISLVRSRNFGPFSGSLLSGIEGQFRIRELFLDGNTFEDSHSVDKNRVVGIAFWGVEVSWERFFIKYIYRLMTEEFTEQKAGGHNYGSIQIGFR